MSNDAFDSIIINLVENIRVEMLNLTKDLHTLELNISTIHRLEEKTDDLKFRFIEIQKKFDHIELLVDELQDKISDVKLIDNLTGSVSRIHDRLNNVEKDVLLLNNQERVRVDASKDTKTLRYSIYVVVITAILNILFWAFTGQPK